MFGRRRGREAAPLNSAASRPSQVPTAVFPLTGTHAGVLGDRTLGRPRQATPQPPRVPRVPGTLARLVSRPSPPVSPPGFGARACRGPRGVSGAFSSVPALCAALSSRLDASRPTPGTPPHVVSRAVPTLKPSPRSSPWAFESSTTSQPDPQVCLDSRVHSMGTVALSQHCPQQRGVLGSSTRSAGCGIVAAANPQPVDAVGALHGAARYPPATHSPKRVMHRFSTALSTVRQHHTRSHWFE